MDIIGARYAKLFEPTDVAQSCLRVSVNRVIFILSLVFFTGVYSDRVVNSAL
jgi:hypothetical protein